MRRLDPISVNQRKVFQRWFRIQSVMNELTQWFLQNAWAGLAVGVATSVVIAAIVIFTLYRLLPPSITGNFPSEQSQEYSRLILFCGDAKALADISIQRCIGNSDFLRRFHAQPSYAALLPYFSPDFQRQMAQEQDDHDGRPILAMACQAEIERLEQEFLAWHPDGDGRRDKFGQGLPRAG